MNQRRSIRCGWMSLALASIAWTSAARAQTDVFFNFNTLSPSTPSGPSAPNGPLVQGADGDLYGTASGEQQDNYGDQGAVFKLSTAGDITVLYTFCTASNNCTDGEEPVGGLVAASDGNFYGMTSGGGSTGNGTVFKVTPQGTFTSLHSFCTQNGCPDGSNPTGGLVQGSDGFLYGTTRSGGANRSGGLFKISTSGELTALYGFCSGSCSDGAMPHGPLVLGADGNFYGTTIGGNSNASNAGTLFRMTPQGVVATLYSFCVSAATCPDGNFPNEIIQGKDGKLYGTTQQGGTYNAGTVFAFTLGSGTAAGTLKTLYSFCNTVNCPVGFLPVAGLVQASDGAFYGTTLHGGEPNSFVGNADAFGTIYKVTAAGAFTSLHTFCFVSVLCPDGFSPDTRLMQASNGLLYGATAFGGANAPANSSGLGVIFSQCLAATTRSPALGQAANYFGECKSEFTVFRPSNGSWYGIDESGKSLSKPWGAATDLPVIGDFDGDSISDVAVFRPSNGTWYITQSSNNQIVAKQWGAATDVPVVGDFDGDGESDIAVFRPSTGYWYIIQSSNEVVVAKQWGAPTDIPVAGDFDGDGKSDIAVFRPSNGTWYISQSSNGAEVARQWGESTDIPVTGDFDGDGKTDIAVFRPSIGTWYIILSSTGKTITQQWGQSGDVPVARDYDGDGKTDIAVFRPAGGEWYVLQSGNGKVLSQQWGISTDIPMNRSSR